jgi:uncharacterized protein (DUF488 family)
LTAIYTIGHSTHELEPFLALLTKEGIAAIADVRSAPYSRRYPQFNREAFRNNLEGCGIRYVFMGSELGGRGSDDSMRDDRGRVRYACIAETAAFNEGIGRVLAGSERMAIALMCAEKDPLYCHRGILISRHLVAYDARVLHIDVEGGIETHHDAEIRLRRLVGLHEPDMFRTDDQILAEAYERQEARIAHVLPASRDRDEALQ